INTMACLLFSLGVTDAQIGVVPKITDEAKVFFITDFSYIHRLNLPNTGSMDLRHGERLNAELGMLVNVGSKYAVGGNAMFSLQLRGEGLPTYMKLRVRRWLSKDACIDFAPGIKIGRRNYIISFDYHFNKWLAITTQIEEGYESLTHGVPNTKGKVYGVFGGIKMSSKPGMYLNGGGVLAGLTYLIIALTVGFST
ncbi:MAG: hypothetical protein KJO50_08265, partial [Bacteroidia bacterium]|nr:hypothetical protein [Bacteroidia bacterium]